MNLTIVLEDEKKELQINNDSKKSLLEILIDNNISIESDCGGNGKCDKCKVRVRELSREYRACELKICNLYKSINEAHNSKNKSISRERVTVEILRDRLAFDMKIEGADKSDIGKILKEVRLDCQNTSDKVFALAIDIGTTTIAFTLVDILKGNVIDTLGMVNSQRRYGTDVISRIKAASSGKKDVLRKCVVDDLIQGTREICTNNGTSVAELNNIVIAGNTTMCHILMGYDCSSLGVYPYTPVNTDSIISDTNRVLGLDDNIPVIIPGAISTYVGADITAGLVATSMLDRDKTSMLIDLGTNGELVLVDKGRIIVTSTAAGPAFEGGNISFGMPSVDGAISHITLNGGMCELETIGKKTPIGICGSGVLDAVYELRKNGYIDENGLLIDRYFDDGYYLYSSISITQEDIRQFLLAKSAVRTGIDIIISKMGIEYEDIDALYIAGGFGKGIDISKAAGIGLIPSKLLDVSLAVGNSSLSGAINISLIYGKCYMESKIDDFNKIIRGIDKVLREAKELDLSNQTDFKNEYLKNMKI